MRRWFERMSTAALERSNPELASAMRKLQRVGTNPDPVKAQQALSQLSADERRAYLDAMQEQGATPEPANRQQRRLQERLQQGTRPGAPARRRAASKPRARRRRAEARREAPRRSSSASPARSMLAAKRMKSWIIPS